MWQLYKYQPINKLTLSNLAQGKLWASHSSAFNDPFEFRLKRASTAEGLDELRRQDPSFHRLNDDELIKQVIEAFERELEKMSIVCFTKVPNDLLMWAHYADSYKGFCLGFCGEGDEEDLSKQGIYPVKYQEEYCKLDFTKIWYKDGLASVLWTKYTAWHYEQEFRRILLQKNMLVDYPGSLNKIIFGLRTSKEDMDLVRSILKKRDDVEYLEITQSDGRYELLVNTI